MAFPQSVENGAEPVGTQVSGDVRRHNLSVVTRYLLDHGATSRSQLAAGTGLTRGSVTALSTVLLDAGILAEGDPADGQGLAPADAAPRSRGKGRPVTLLDISADHVAIVALQLDADKVTALLTTLAGETLFRVTQSHGRPMGAPDPILDLLAVVFGQAVDACLGMGRRIADVVVVVFAPVGGEPAVVLADTDLGWWSVDVLAGVRQRDPRLPDSTRLLPDSTLAAQAELGLLADTRDMIYLKSNSGIGGAIISGGSLIEGAHKLAGALGHLPLVPAGDLCGCGQHGCLVTVAGPDVILQAAGLESLLASGGLTAALAELSARIAAGEPRATAAWESASEWICRELQILAMAFDPQVIVLGGYWAALSDSVAKRFDQNWPRPSSEVHWPGPGVRAGQLGEDAALLGAIWDVRDRLLRDPLQMSI